MNARAEYSLHYVQPGRRSSWLRRSLVAVVGILSMGEPVSPAGGRIQIADRLTGRVLGGVDVAFGDDGFTRARMDEDLLTLTAEAFAARWIADPAPGKT